ncbi:MAG TPA: lycopene cyclase family protein [Anaerolineae bacterium]|nr:lycopene cyclase family protein [Anaerolineae bacterium]
MTHYDFVLAGGGLAGLSLACRLAETAAFDQRSILLVEQDAKTRNDRTFSFWSDGPGPFDAAICRTWDRLRVAGPDGAQDLDLGDYRYHTIRGLDFYRHAQQQLAQHANVELRSGHVQRIDDGPNAATVVVDGEAITGRWVFDSRPARLADQSAADRHTRLKLHFRGWEIETPTAAFDPGIATFMDFRTPQDGDVRFFYVLPFSPNRALVEYTLFTDQRLTHEDTEQAIATYVQSTLGINDFRIVAEEGGCLPITDAPFPRRLGQRVMAVGVKGGRIKPSTGYAFSRVQADSEAIVQSLLDHGHPFALPAGPASYRWLDAVMLRVMRDHGELIAPAFAAMFSRNPTARILRFLDEQASPLDVLAIMASLPAALFVGTALEMAVGRTGKEGKERKEGGGEMRPRKLWPA